MNVFSVWHNKTPQDIIDLLNSSEGGLTEEEAKKRLKENGLNELPAEKESGVLKIFFSQFKSPLIYVLLLAALVVSVVGEITDGFIIFAVLFINAIIGTFQEGKARKTLNSLKDFSKGRVVVLRNEMEIEIDDTEIVVGDILIIRSGDKIGADARVISSQSLKVNESALTGESESVSKDSEILLENTEISDRKNMVFKGSLAVFGQARAIVVAVGIDTLIGKISQKLEKIESEMPLQKKMKKFSRFLALAVFVAAVLIVIIGLLRGISIKEIFFTATAVSVSLIPEGLPVVITLILAKGVYRMAKRNALVKNMQAVEALGQASILAVDKTGTITKNELMIQKIFVDGKIFDILGSGYEIKGDVRLGDKTIDPANHPELLFAGKAAARCSDASVEEVLETGEIKIIGDPTEAAISVFGQKIGFKKEELETEEPKIFEIPFSSEHKFRATLHKEKGNFALTVIGAPEVIIQKSENVWTANGDHQISIEDRINIEKKIEEFSSEGLRVLGFGVFLGQDSSIDVENVPKLCFGGIFAMADVLREEVPSLIQAAQESGVKTVMITGDFMKTAEAIAEKAGIWQVGDVVMSGSEIALLNRHDFDSKLEKVSVFGRVLPEHKLAIVEAYKNKGEIIGMTGDGVNDALSLSAADLGIAMGRGGTDVAKEAADIILLDNNFKSILAAIEEGRTIYKTIKKVVLYLISTSIGEFLTILGAIILGLSLPIFPTQILWLNLVTDGVLVVALAFEPNEPLRKIKKQDNSIINKNDFIRSIMMGVIMMLGSIALFAGAYKNGDPAAWTLSLTILAVFQWFNVWNCRSDKDSLFKKIFSNPYLIVGFIVSVVAHLFALYNPYMQKLLKTTPLDIKDWLVIIGLALSIILIEEIRKFFVRLKND